MKTFLKILISIFIVMWIFNLFRHIPFIVDLFRLEHYFPEKIEEVKISQNKSRESAKLWQSEEIINRYKESTSELSRINEIYSEIDNNYSRIIQIMEEKKKYLSLEDEKFLDARESKLLDELKRLRDTVDIRLKISIWKSEIEGMIITQDKYSNFFKGNKPSNNIELDYSNFKEISNYIINTDRLIITKLESNQELSEQEIDYSLNIRTKKINESIDIYYRINDYIKLK